MPEIRVTRDYVLGLEVVLADGTLVRLGGRTHKNKAGFDLSRLFVGSEGLLGIVTEATLKLLPLPPFRACLAVGFASTGGATAALPAIFAAGFLPCALEIADAFTLAAAQRRTGSRRFSGCGAHLIVELDGHRLRFFPSSRISNVVCSALRSLCNAAGTAGTERSGSSGVNSRMPCATPA